MPKNFLLNTLYFRQVLFGLLLYGTLIFFHSQKTQQLSTEKQRLELQLKLERAGDSYTKKSMTFEEIKKRYSPFAPRLQNSTAKLDKNHIRSSIEVSEEQHLTFTTKREAFYSHYLDQLRRYFGCYLFYLALISYLYLKDKKSFKESLHDLKRITDNKVINTFSTSSDFHSLADKITKTRMQNHSKTTLLQEQNDYWAKLFENFPAGIILINQDDFVLDFNPAVFLSLKLPSISKTSEKISFQDLVPIEEISHFYQKSKKEDQKIYTEEIHCLRNNTREVFKATSISLSNEQENKTGTLLVLEDITTFKRLEEMRTDFASNVSHELKTPITIIRAYVETIQNALEDSPELALKFLYKVEKSAERMTDIIEDLSVLAKIEQDATWVSKGFEERELNKTINAALTLCQAEAEQKGIDLKPLLENPGYYLSTTIKANHRLLEQALRNLIENAIRYSPEKSKVTIRSRYTNDEIKISIQDNGPGISPEDQSKIFERFYRVDKSRDRDTGGSGLGLAIVKHIIRVHNARIELDSEIGEGSTFTIYIKR